MSAAVRFDDEEFDVADLVLLALAEGQWQRLEARLARGLALAREHGRNAAPDRVAEDVKRLRYARRLISGKELREWLAARSLVLEDVRLHSVRNVLLQEYGGEGERVAPSELAEVLMAEAIISRTLSAAAARLGDLAAMTAGAGTDTDTELPAAGLAGLLVEVAAHPAAGLGELGDAELERRARRILSLLGAEAAFVARVATPRAVASCFAEHGVDWLRVECLELTLANEGAARESMLCLRLDGTPLADLSQQLQILPHLRELYCGRLSRRVRPCAGIGRHRRPHRAVRGRRGLAGAGRQQRGSRRSREDPELAAAGDRDDRSERAGARQGRTGA